jgi:hypothetical protein
MNTNLNLRLMEPEVASSLPEHVLFRIVRRDGRGRVFGTPRNPRTPTIVEFNARIADVSVGELLVLIVVFRHGVFPEQCQRVAQLRNQDLLAFRSDDPMSATLVTEGLSLTGGHHRVHEIKRRVLSGELDASAIIRILIHD